MELIDAILIIINIHFLLINIKQCIRKKAAEMENSREEELRILRERISSLQVSEDRV